MMSVRASISCGDESRGVVGERQDAGVLDPEQGADPLQFGPLALRLLAAGPLEDLGAAFLRGLAHLVLELLVVGGDAVAEGYHGDAVPALDVVGGGPQGVGHVVRVGR